MTDKEFKRLRRGDLIEIIYQMQEDADALRQENDRLNRELADRRTKIEEAGSIAEATVALNRLFQTAQATADDYLAEINQLRHQARLELETARKTCEAAVNAAKRGVPPAETKGK